MELKPGMRVRVEYETVAQSRYGGDQLWIPGIGYRNSDGSPAATNTLARENVKVTPVPVTYEVTATVTVPAVASDGWEQELQRRVDNALDKLSHQGLKVDVKRVND